jgi:hypothetical protein
MEEVMKNTVLACACIAAAVLFGGCGGDDALNALLGTSAAAPVYTGYKVISGTQVDFYFSAEVRVVSAHFEPEAGIERTEDGNTVSVLWTSDHSGGEKFIADILVEDEGGNSLSVLVPFRTRNDRIPALLFNELRFDYSKPRSEFIEFKTLSAGNLGALRLFITSANAAAPVYEFPPVEVSKGEYVILHLRTLATDTAVDELGSTLSLSASKNNAEAPTDARDLWIPASKKLLHKTDVLYLMDQDDRIVDGLITCEDEKAWKKNAAFSKAAELLARQGKWLSKDGVAVRAPQVEDAVRSDGTSVTKTLCRSEARAPSMTNNDWYICETSKCSPGKPNNH